MLDVAAIRGLLPHGHPMLLVDSVLEVEPGRAIVALKSVTHAEPCFAGLPSDAPSDDYAYPESLLLESFGQSAALMWLLRRDATVSDDSVLMLAVARDCRIESDARPGEVIRHEARLDSVVGDNVFVSGESFVADRRILSVGSMVAVIRPAGAVGARDGRDRQPQPQETR